MDEKRLRELESWLREDREDLTLSEIVLLDAISEACVEIRRSWDAESTSRAELERSLEELERDRQAMEGADLELALGDSDALEKVRAILGERLEGRGSPEGEGSAGRASQVRTET